MVGCVQGLKTLHSRSREGARIEIYAATCKKCDGYRRSREGARIEIMLNKYLVH